MTDFVEMLLAARLSQAAYDTYPVDIAKRVGSLGGISRGVKSTDDCSIFVCDFGRKQWVVVRGTRVTDDFSAKELLDDCDTDAITTRYGRVMDGFWTPLSKIWPSVEMMIDPTRPFTATGHSLGGIRAELIPALSSRCNRVISFGAPQGAEIPFWTAAYGDRVDLTRVVHADDFAPGWPWLDGLTVEFEHPPGPFLWLHDGGFDETTTRPALNLSIESHSIDTGYLPAIESLAESQQTEQANRKTAPMGKPVKIDALSTPHKIKESQELPIRGRMIGKGAKWDG